MTDAEIIVNLKGELGEDAVEVTNPSVRRIYIRVPAGRLVPTVTALRDRCGFRYLSTISGLDKGEAFEIIYHFADERVNLNLRTEIPRNDPHIESISPVIPGAILYEREIQEMFGVVVDNIPDPRPLLMPDGWPAGNYPLRKDWKYERPEEIIPGGKK